MACYLTSAARNPALPCIATNIMFPVVTERILPKPTLVQSPRGERVTIRMLLGRAQAYIPSAGRITVLQYLPAGAALCTAVAGMVVISAVPSSRLALLDRLAYLAVWTALGTTLLLYIFLGLTASLHGKDSDLERLDPALPQRVLSWRYVEPLAVLLLIAAGIRLFSL